MLAIRVTVLAVTCLTDECPLILVFLDINPTGPVMLALFPFKAT